MTPSFVLSCFAIRQILTKFCVCFFRMLVNFLVIAYTENVSNFVPCYIENFMISFSNCLKLMLFVFLSNVGKIFVKSFSLQLNC